MSANKKHRINIRKIVTAALIVFAVTVATYASSATAVLEQYVTEDSVMLYVKHSGENLTASARIGTEAVGDANLMQADDVHIVTWLLVDNSVSIGSSDRTKTKQLLADLVAGRASNERFNLCTHHDDKLEILVQDSQNYADLKGQIDALQYANQKSYLTDVLNELLNIEKARENLVYARIVVISDGGDDNPAGLTREELNQRLKEQRLPIYTLGCQSMNNTQILKELYALSRQTDGQSWSLSELSDTLSIVQAMSGPELPICVRVTIPEKLRDGTSKGLQITFSDGTVAETQVPMPFGAVTEPDSSPTEEMPVQIVEPEPEPIPEPEPEKKSFWEENSTLMIVILAITAALLVGLIVFLLLRRKRKNERIRVVDTTIDMGQDRTDFAETSSGGDRAVFLRA